MTTPTVLVVHPGAELYGSDRVLLDSVLGFLGAGNRVVAVLPGVGLLSEALTDAGAEVTIAPAFVLRKRLLRPAGWRELIRTGCTGAWSAWRTLGRIRPDAVYVSTITLPLWPVLGRLRGVPVILHVHEGEASASRITKAVLYAPALFARRILVNSEFSLAVMAAAYPRLVARSVVVRNAVPGPPASSPPRSHLDGQLRVLFIGRLSPRKGADIAIAAVRALNEGGIRASLDIVGSAFEGYETYEESLQTAIKDAAMTDRIFLRGFHRGVWKFLDENDVLVVPSRLDEPFGNTAIEGLLAARPLVASDTSGLREATADVSTAWRVVPDSVPDLVDALVKVFDSWPTVRLQVETSRKQAAELYSPEHYQARVAELVTGATSRT